MQINRQHVIISFSLLAIAVLGNLLKESLRIGRKDPSLALRASAGTLQNSTTYHECGYRSYPWPANHSGLPYLADVFRSPSLSEVVFVGTSRSECQEQYKQTDEVFFNRKNKRKVRFLCEFPDGTKVLSDYVHPAEPFKWAFTFRCKIPTEYREADVRKDKTALTVSLYALEDLYDDPFDESKPPVHASTVLKEGLHSIPHIPVCSNVWPDDTTPSNLAIDADHNGTDKRYDLIVFTLIKMVSADWMTFHLHSDGSNKKMRNETTHLFEWIEYHREMGVQHFVIYDNDNEDHVGPLKQLLLPYIERGIVTYAWFPLPFCEVDHGGWKGYSSGRGHFAAELSALHRFGAYTRYYGDIDVDEMYALRPTSKTHQSQPLLPLLRKKLEDEHFDVVTFKPYVMAACNGAHVNPSMLRMEQWRCFTGQHYADQKIIMRADRMLYYAVHYPVTTVNWTTPRKYNLNEEKEGLLVHYRKKNEYTFGADDFEGIVVSKFNNTWELMDQWAPRIKERIQTVEKEWLHNNNVT